MTTVQSAPTGPEQQQQHHHHHHRPPSPALSQLPPIPSSPTYSYASTTNPPSANINMSTFTLPLPPPPPPKQYAVLTKADLAASQKSYADLLTTAKSYRVALAGLSNAASAFGSALESCARLKEARADSIHLADAAPAAPAPVTSSSGCTADTLLAAAGVHHLIANHEQILSETVYRSFEVPLLHELDKWRRDVEDEEATYLAAVRRQSQDIRRMEKEGMRLHRQRGPRDVAKFRGHLVELTTKLDGLTGLHGEHSRTLLRESQDTSVKILEACCSLVRAEVDIFESLARKGWSGGGLEEILEKGTDLFAAEPATADVETDSSKLFSILPPKSILADAAVDSGLAGITRPGGGNGGGGKGHDRADSLGVPTETYQSLAGAVVSPEFRAVQDNTDSMSIFSVDFNNNGGGGGGGGGGRPRMTRPFSPQPVRVNPEDVLRDHDDDDDDDDATSQATTRDGGLDDGESRDDDGPSSPETIRDRSRSTSADRCWMAGDLSLSTGGDTEDDHPWRDKRISTAVSDPDERERRWELAGDELE
ncbi:Protein IVY1 [Cytospora mali]|uniref:Protein IVY1 n=1 Tax=Cytospora mali TaxID=578113 RepID=A0A194URL3_CYTMA|nr:Protein IVY1 [Valsa mali var. pyri (nom. inval.)]